jgi:hypothetical protein
MERTRDGRLSDLVRLHLPAGLQEGMAIMSYAGMQRDCDKTSRAPLQGTEPYFARYRACVLPSSLTERLIVESSASLHAEAEHVVIYGELWRLMICTSPAITCTRRPHHH